MTATGMNHFTVLTDDVPATVDFYRDLIGLTEGPRPPARLPGSLALLGPCGHPARGRRPPEKRASRRRDRPHGLQRDRPSGDDRGVRREGNPVPMPSAEGIGRMAGIPARPQRCAGRARFRPGRAGAAVSAVGPPAPLATLDHLVVAAATIADGIEYFAEISGVAPQPGGKHVAMGTHNALVRLSGTTYLEIIAIDPDGAKPARPRWFDLDNIALQAELAERPRLIHWVARTTAIERAAAACAVPLGPVHPMTRGTYRWRMTIPEDGKLPAKGIVPTLIEWDVPGASGGIAAEVERVDRGPRRGASRSRRDPRGARHPRSRRRAAGDLRPRRATGGDAAHAARHRDALIAAPGYFAFGR